MSTTVDLGKITASVDVGTTTTGAAGTNASVTNVGTTQDAVLNFTIPRGAQGVQGPQGIQGNTGPAGPTGPQGPMGDVAVITPEQQSAFTMYSVPGQNTDGPMTQKAVTDNLVASAISYDNSTSGLASDNVQGAVDEITSEIPTEIHSTWVVGSISTVTGADADNWSRIRSKYIAVKNNDIIKVNSNGHYVGIYLYNTDKTSALGQYAVLYTDGYGEFVYKCPQDGFVRFIESKAPDSTQHIYPSEQVAEIMRIPDLVYVLKTEMEERLKLKADLDDITDLINLDKIAQGVGYPELASGKWRTKIIGGTNRYHKVLERKSGMDFIKIDSDTNKTARYCFLTDYPNALASNVNDSVYTVDFCEGHSTVYSIPQNSSSGWIEIPSDCKYIVLIELNIAVNYLPKSVYVVKDVEDEVIGYQLPFFCFWQGTLATADGMDASSTSRIKTGFLPVKQGDRIHINYNNQHVSIREFDSSKTQIFGVSWYAKQEYICQSNGYVRFIVANKAASGSEMKPSDLTAAITIPIDTDNRITHGDWRSKGGFVVGSWNIGHFSHGGQTDSTITASTYETMKAAYKKAVEYMDADLISLSEYSPIFYGSETARAALFDDVSWGHVGVQRKYACQAVYADYKIEGVSDIDITSVTTTHYYTVITFEHFGKTVKLISVHIQANADIPAQFTELINAFANDEYVIITGDFNVTNMADLSAFTNAGYTIANGGAWGNIETFTRTKTSDGYCLDNIVTKGFYMTDVKTFPYELSDHYPFVCRLMLKQN